MSDVRIYEFLRNDEDMSQSSRLVLELLIEREALAAQLVAATNSRHLAEDIAYQSNVEAENLDELARESIAAALTQAQTERTKAETAGAAVGRLRQALLAVVSGEDPELLDLYEETAKHQWPRL